MHSTTLVAFVGGLIDHAQPSQPSTFSDPTNFFDYNIYEFFPVSQGPSWSWGETANFLQPTSWSAWQANSQNPNETVWSIFSHSTFIWRNG